MTYKPSEQIAALIERMGRLLSTEAHAEGLLPVHWEALRYLSRANRFSRSPAALTAYLGTTKGTVSQTVNTLESKGLVRKQVNRQDLRSKNLSLTATGKRLLRRDPLDATIAAVENLTKPSQDELTKSLQSLLSQRLTAQDRQPFGQCQDCQHFARRHIDGGPHYCLLLHEALAEKEIQSICFEQTPI